jgi:hypothetical protein
MKSEAVSTRSTVLTSSTPLNTPVELFTGGDLTDFSAFPDNFICSLVYFVGHVDLNQFANYEGGGVDFELKFYLGSIQISHLPLRATTAPYAAQLAGGFPNIFGWNDTINVAITPINGVVSSDGILGNGLISLTTTVYESYEVAE